MPIADFNLDPTAPIRLLEIEGKEIHFTRSSMEQELTESRRRFMLQDHQGFMRSGGDGFFGLSTSMPTILRGCRELWPARHVSFSLAAWKASRSRRFALSRTQVITNLNFNLMRLRVPKDVSEPFGSNFVDLSRKSGKTGF
jgi:hypothetical protein